MLKYTDEQITFAEIPDEVTLCINLSNCPCHCKGCHSSYLAEDIGQVLTFSRIEKLLEKYKGITAICFMGGDNDPELINHYARLIKRSYIDKVECKCKISRTISLSKGMILNPSDDIFLKSSKLNPIKVGWYSGRQELAKEIDINNFDFIKLGPYLEECGPLNCATTNQRFYEIVHISVGYSKMYDVTYKFWKHET